jgi:hypothetical protein
VEDLRRLREMDGEDADQQNPTIAAHRASWRRVTDSMHRRS